MLSFLWRYAIIQPHAGYLYGFQMVFDAHTKESRFGLFQRDAGGRLLIAEYTNTKLLTQKTLITLLLKKGEKKIH